MVLQCFDFAADKSIGIVALRFPRDVTLPSGTVRHYFDADGGTAGAGAVDDSTAISIGLTDGYAYHSWQPSATRSARYWRFLYAATGVSVVDTGIAWAGETWSPDVNISYDYTDAWEDLSAGSQGVRSGSVFWDVRPRRRKIAFSIDVLSETERKTVREMNRIAGISSQVLAIIRPDDAATETIIGTLTQSSPIRHPYFNISSAVFEIQESL